MSREQINEKDIDSVVGGAIVFNSAHTTCGRNCNNQYSVLNYDKVCEYIASHYETLSEKKMLANMVSLGLIAPLPQD